MKRMIGAIGLLLCAVGCGDKAYQRSVTFKQSQYLQPPEVQVDLSQVPGDWIVARQTTREWGNTDETIEFANAHNRRVKIIVVPLDRVPTTQP